MAIEKKFVSQKIREFNLKQFISKQLSRVGLSDIKLQRTPLGDKVVIRVSRPGLVVGRRGSNIQRLTDVLKNEFHLENPQIEIEEVKNYGLDANVMAEMIVNSLERFGSQRFKGVGHKAVMDVMRAGAKGVEIIISGKIPSMRAKSWRFYQGYMKKCGDVAVSGVDVAYKVAVLKTGVIGVKVMIMPPTTRLPDEIIIKDDQPEPVVEELTSEESAAVKKEIVENADADAEVKESLVKEDNENKEKESKESKSKAKKSKSDKSKSIKKKSSKKAKSDKETKKTKETKKDKEQKEQKEKNEKTEKVEKTENSEKTETAENTDTKDSNDNKKNEKAADDKESDNS